MFKENKDKYFNYIIEKNVKSKKKELKINKEKY